MFKIIEIRKVRKNHYNLYIRKGFLKGSFAKILIGGEK